ncbi:hypothetical protein TRFO_24344 [Tritrichomonas foetus]|uniref:Uncharacterized protein n=1 Tax=Tritrichomonas foetus TaxID=1144522 RepID=A0A1J4KCS4_9EUKA|nr:hypothetical protein TRFO_24344 [Tritrichomonas foetus]|eukprot:OHT07446.1 hypothetical protein TRFO_24344 [Tritrichomonas foetus]
MNNFVLPIQLQTKFAVSTANDHANASFKTLDQAIGAVCNIRNDIASLERAKALYVTYLRDYQADFDVMRALYNDLRLRLDNFDSSSNYGKNGPFFGSSSIDIQKSLNGNEITNNQQQYNHNSSISSMGPNSNSNINVNKNLNNNNNNNNNINLNTSTNLNSNSNLQNGQINQLNPIQQQMNQYQQQQQLQQQQQMNHQIHNKENDQTPYVKPETLAQVGLSQVVPNWNLSSNILVKQRDILNKFSLTSNSVLCSVQYDSNGRTMAFADGRFLFIGNAKTGQIEKLCDIPRVPGRNELHSRILRFSPDGKLIALSCSIVDIALFNVANGAQIATFEGHTSTVSSLAFFSDGNRLVSGGYDGSVCLWDIHQATLIRKFQHGNLNNQISSQLINTSNTNPNSNPNSNNNPNSGVMNNNGNSSVTGEESGGKEIAIVSIAIGANDSYVAVGFMKGVVGLYEPTMTQPINCFTAHSDYLLNLAASPTDETLLLTCSQDRTVKIWSLKGVASCVMTLNGHADYVITACFSPNNKFVFTGSKDETLCCWNRFTGERLFQIQAHLNTIFEVAHNPCAQEFLSCSGEGLVCSWEYNIPQ